MPSNALSNLLNRNLGLSRSFSSIPRLKLSDRISKPDSSEIHYTDILAASVTQAREETTSSYAKDNSHSVREPQPTPVSSQSPPVIRSPHELLERTMRRRYAHLAYTLQKPRVQPSNSPDETSISVAIAHSLPPDHLEPPPEYISQPSQRHLLTSGTIPRPRSTISEQRTDELFLQPLRDEIDETILQYSSMISCQSTPTSAIHMPVTVISPMNILDRDYLFGIQSYSQMPYVASI